MTVRFPGVMCQRVIFFSSFSPVRWLTLHTRGGVDIATAVSIGMSPISVAMMVPRATHSQSAPSPVNPDSIPRDARQPPGPPDRPSAQIVRVIDSAASRGIVQRRRPGSAAGSSPRTTLSTSRASAASSATPRYHFDRTRDMNVCDALVTTRGFDENVMIRISGQWTQAHAVAQIVTSIVFKQRGGMLMIWFCARSTDVCTARSTMSAHSFAE